MNFTFNKPIIKNNNIVAILLNCVFAIVKSVENKRINCWVLYIDRVDKKMRFQTNMKPQPYYRER